MKKINGAAGFVLRSASLAGIVALASNTVLADGLPDLKGESYEQPSIWTGAYIGAHLGGRWGGYDVTVTEAASLDPQGLIGGVQAGYDVQAGRLVLGVEADISFGNGDAAFTDNSVLAASVELGAEGTLTARIGLPAGELVPYIKGGLAWTRVNVTGDLLHDGAPSGGRHAIEDTETLTGWTIGGGLEYALHDHWTTRAEYLYADYGSFSTTNSEGDTFRHELETHSLRLCVNYKFGD